MTIGSPCSSLTWPPPDVEVSDTVGVVQAPEEQGDRRVVGELLHPKGERGPQVLAADPVAAGRGVHPAGPLTHPAQLLAGLGQVLLFGFEVGGRASRWVRGHGQPPRATREDERAGRRYAAARALSSGFAPGSRRSPHAMANATARNSAVIPES
jgi:hypothetical protein